MKFQLSVASVVALTLSCRVALAEDPPAVPDILRTPATRTALAAPFALPDQALLEEIEHASFLYFWKEVGTPAELVRDRQKGPVASVAAVGFQLSSLPIGVERGWITREQGEKRARTVLGTLAARADNRRFGVLLHYPDLNTGGQSAAGYEFLTSTVDHALFLAGAITAGEYFGGEVQKLADRFVAETQWKAFEQKPQGLLAMGWGPDDPQNLAGPGKLTDSIWKDAGDEERLIYFLGTGAPTADNALDPALYYRLQRIVKQHGDLPPYVVTWPGALFTYTFSHCWIDYRRFDADEPKLFGVEAPRVDWVENSRRAMLTHRQRCLEQIGQFKSFAPDRWGLSACAGRDGYIVPNVRPNIWDRDDWFDGTIAPYAAGSGIMFTPAESVAALRAFRSLKAADGTPMVWRDPQTGGYGLVDSFNLDQNYAHDDYVGIDQGPLLLAIENARTGLVWKLFMQSETAKRAVERLRLKAEQGP